MTNSSGIWLCVFPRYVPCFIINLVTIGRDPQCLQYLGVALITTVRCWCCMLCVMRWAGCNISYTYFTISKNNERNYCASAFHCNSFGYSRFLRALHPHRLQRRRIWRQIRKIESPPHPQIPPPHLPTHQPQLQAIPSSLWMIVFEPLLSWNFLMAWTNQWVEWLARLFTSFRRRLQSA